MTHICMVHNNFDDRSSIGRLAKWAAEVALEAGMRVTLVADKVDPVLAKAATVRPLYIPPKLHAVQWLAARATIRRAMGGVSYDLVHVHQPQVAALADIWQVHFLSRANARSGGMTGIDSLRTAAHRAQEEIVVRAEGHYLRRLPASTEVLFCSEWLRDEFAALYGAPATQGVLVNPGPPAQPPTPEAQRAAARARFELPVDEFVVGYLGGRDRRKGYAELIDRVAEAPEVHLLLAGSGSEEIEDARLGTRLHPAGRLSGADLGDFFAAVDVLAVPSRFDPCPVVVNEAASRGVPVLASPRVGNGTEVARYGAGFVWDALQQPLAPAVAKLRADSAGYADRARSMADALSYEQRAKLLLEHYSAAAERRRAS